MTDTTDREAQSQANEAEPNRPSRFDERRLWPILIPATAVMWVLLFAEAGWAALWAVAAILLALAIGPFIGGKIAKWLYPPAR
jgi:hypothetical protein